MSIKKKCIFVIVGAGSAGLIVAAMLAKGEKGVVIIEKNNAVVKVFKKYLL